MIIDNCFCIEHASLQASEHGESEEAETSLAASVLKETMFGSKRAYVLRSKKESDCHRIAGQIVDGTNAVGPAREGVVVKSDHKLAIVDIQPEFARQRG